MATFNAGVTTTATGALALTFDLTEQRALDIFAMLLGTAAPITRQRTVPDPFPGDPNRTKVESYQDARTLPEALSDRITIFIDAIDAEAIAYKKTVAAAAAAAAITDAPGVTAAT